VQFGFAAALPAGSWSPRFAISFFSNMGYLRVEIAYAACSRYAIWLRRCAARWRLVTAIGD